MKERPILFSAPMVRAILDGRKTQTRRIIKPFPASGLSVQDLLVDSFSPTKFDKHGEAYPGPECFGAYDVYGEWGAKCPHGKPSERLWVRESFHITKGAQRWKDGTALYRADHGFGIGGSYVDCALWKPSIHMPRAVSRINLEIADVRVERLQDISESDAQAEGVEYECGWEEQRGEGYKCGGGFLNYLSEDEAYDFDTAKDSFSTLWAKINGQESWAASPWVWVIEFKKL